VNDGTNITITDYLDGFQYNQQVLEFFPHAEGYVKATPTGLVPPGTPPSTYAFNYVFNYTDHLGNVRVSYTKDPQTGNLKILDESHYYPFGLKHQEYSTFGFVNNPIQGVVIAPLINNPYKYEYNGKEWQDELGFGFYTFGFRDYMPDIGRFATIDPMADFVNHQSPYVMANNNPVIYEDVYGLGIINAIGNLVKRAVNGLKSLVPRSMRGCSCNTETKESLGDAFRRPDFPGSGRSSGGGSPNRSSSPSSTPSKGNNKVVSTIDIPEAGLDMNNFSPEISMNINLPDLDNFFPKPTGVENSAIFSRTPPRVGDTYSIPITFNSSTTSIRNTSLNEKALNDLLKVMQNDPKLNLLILGNVVFNPPLQNNNQTIVNVSVGTVGDLKIGRDRAVESFLIERCINP
jgi:RHS repeat-associated protein